MATGKRLPALELTDDEERAAPVSLAREPVPSRSSQRSIPLPPIPAARRREFMVQLSVKAPYALVERLERMNVATGAQKQAILAAALEAYLSGHGY